MSSSAMRGAALMALAVVLGFLILRGAANNEQVPLSSSVAPTPLPTLVAEPDDSVAVATPTVIVVTGDARDNNQVTVLVVNGTEVSGQASRLTSALRNQGFITREPRNSVAQAASVIYYRPDYASEATVVRNVLGGSTPIAPMPEPDPFLGDNIDLAPVNVLVLVGDDALATS